VTTGSSPLVQRRRLRAELRQARIDAQLTQETVANEMDWSLSKVIRIETGSVGVSTNDLNALLRLYRVKDQQRRRDLVALGKAARQQSWYSKYRGVVPATYFQFIEYETSASVIRSYESLLVPGLLQTEDYATALLRLYRTNPSPEAVQARVEIRMRRQQLLSDRADSPSAIFVLDEAVIRRLMGDKRTRHGQVARLVTAASQPGLTIEIVPFSVGLHRGIGENFTILEFGDPSDDDILYTESVRDSIFSKDDAEEISIYRELFEELRKVSLGRKASLDFLSEVAGTLA
jgi:transcriptional regulator with XRE-family HTH domain